MSNIAKKPITIANGASVTMNGQEVTVTGPKGTGVFQVPEGVTATITGDVLTISVAKDADKAVTALSGLSRALIANIVKGVTVGFVKKLELAGVGYRAQMQGQELVLSLGFSHPVKFSALPGVNITVTDNVITITGSDKATVGQQAATIRAVKPPEPYKGKGIKYQGERIRRKAGKAAKAGAK